MLLIKYRELRQSQGVDQFLGQVEPENHHLRLEVVDHLLRFHCRLTYDLLHESHSEADFKNEDQHLPNSPHHYFLKAEMILKVHHFPDEHR